MRLDALDWGPDGTSGYWEVARERPIAVYRATTTHPVIPTRGTYTIYEHEQAWINSRPVSSGAYPRVWRDLDGITAQAILFHLTQGGNS